MSHTSTYRCVVHLWFIQSQLGESKIWEKLTKPNLKNQDVCHMHH